MRARSAPVGRARCRPSTKAARIPSDTATARTPAAPRPIAAPSRSATSAIGSSVSSQVATVTAPDVGRRAASGRGSPRAVGRSASSAPRRLRDHQQRQALERHRVVAGEVPQVRADPDQQGIQAGGGRPHDGPRRGARRIDLRESRPDRSCRLLRCRERSEPPGELPVRVLEQDAVGMHPACAGSQGRPAQRRVVVGCHRDRRDRRARSPCAGRPADRRRARSCPR